MTKWEYMFLDEHENNAMTLADEFGEKGWEMITAQRQGYTWYMVFKRAIPESTTDDVLGG